MPITTEVVSLNPANGEVYLIQHYMIKFVSDMRHVSGFLQVLRLPPRYKWNIVESDAKHHNPNPSKIGTMYSQINYTVD